MARMQDDSWYELPEVQPGVFIAVIAFGSVGRSANVAATSAASLIDAAGDSKHHRLASAAPTRRTPPGSRWRSAAGTAAQPPRGSAGRAPPGLRLRASPRNAGRHDPARPL